MPEVEVKNLNNDVVGKVTLSDEVFGLEYNEHLIWEAVQHYLAAQRKGTASTKTRAEVSGSGKKLWKQKGTGRARIGSVRSPLWRHGGTVHGPKPRSYDFSFPKRKNRGAMISALSAKLAENKLTVVDSLEIPEPKTKRVASALKVLAESPKLLIVDTGDSRNFSLGSRNLPGVSFVRTDNLNIYHVASHDHVLLSQAAVEKLQEVLGQ
jgi:large subunit ribosomal protein L4